MARRSLVTVMFTAILATGPFAVPVNASIIDGKPNAAATPVNVSPPTITGIPAVGNALSCSTGGWTNGASAFSFAWLRDGSPIVGQSGSSYLVQAADRGHSISCRVTASNGSGSYAIGSLPSGSYRVQFSAQTEAGSNYLGQFYNGKGLFSEATAVPVTAPSAVGGINAEMHAGGQISGRAVDASTSAPLEGIFVCAEEATGEASRGCTLTGSNGEYTISGLPGGAYKVEFSTFFSAASYYPQFFNEKTSFGTADTVNVTAGADSTGINARMHSTDEGGRISGTVTKAVGGAAIEGVEVCAYSEALFLEQCAVTDSSGGYTIAGLAQANYEVFFSPETCSESGCTPLNYTPQYYDEKQLSEIPDQVAVTKNATTTGIDGKLVEGGEISGRVTGPSGEALADVFACAETAGAIKCGISNGNGEYTLRGLPASTYTVSFEAFSGGFVPLFYNETTKFGEMTPVPVSTGKATTGINAKMVRGGRIAGTVSDATSHQPLAEVQACAYEGGSPVGCALTGPGGEYEITGLEGGTYEVVFSARGESLNYLPQSIAGVTVGLGGDATGENAGLQPGGQIVGVVTDAGTHKGIAGMQVCAEQIGGTAGKCAMTDAESPAQSATSAAVTIAAGGFKLVGKPVFDAKAEDIDFFFDFSTPGKLSWSLFFRNADVGFADSLGVSLGEGTTVAEAAKKGKAKKIKKCKKGEVKHHGRCKRILVSFASGSKTVAAGTVEVKVHAGSKALKALKSGHVLHVSGKFRFQPTLGPATTLTEAVTVKPPKKKHKKGKAKGKGKKR